MCVLLLLPLTHYFYLSYLLAQSDLSSQMLSPQLVPHPAPNRPIRTQLHPPIKTLLSHSPSLHHHHPLLFPTNQLAPPLLPPNLTPVVAHPPLAPSPCQPHSPLSLSHLPPNLSLTHPPDPNRPIRKQRVRIRVWLWGRMALANQCKDRGV